ncbi:conserved hypothetical protein [Trichinella spiralis]|uniref:hypothetical protein n=1 Tax=Trichinella spiralis TaxID=6334 RepID=UPI0001EFEE4C|nr:conserved hypothetical protein [Trichinella spiralis]
MESLCCHYNVTVGNTPAITGLCVQHALKEGQKCFDSCQCELGLNCFRNRLDKNPLSILDQKSEVSMPAVLINAVSWMQRIFSGIRTQHNTTRTPECNGQNVSTGKEASQKPPLPPPPPTTILMPLRTPPPNGTNSVQ